MLAKIKTLPTDIKQYFVITANYWSFTLTDGALRMLVLLHFYQLGYTPLALAMLFVFGSTRDVTLGRKIFFGIAHVSIRWLSKNIRRSST